MNKQLQQRIYTSLVIMVVYVATILLTMYVNRFFYDALIVFMMIISGYEMCRAIANKFEKPISLFVILNSVLGYVAFYVVHHYIGNQSGGITAFFGQLFLIFLVCIVYSMFSTHVSIKNVISTMFVLVYPISILAYLLALNYIPAGIGYSNLAIIMTFLVSCSTDVFAFLVGCTIKGKKLAPSISPKKTISGAIGGLFGGVVAGLALYGLYFSGAFEIAGFGDNTTTLINMIVLGVICSIANQLGDLIASYVKRNCDIKDFSALLPGHGGMMDRVDGMMLVAVVVFGYLMVFTNFF